MLGVAVCVTVCVYAASVRVTHRLVWCGEDSVVMYWKQLGLLMVSQIPAFKSGAPADAC